MGSKETGRLHVIFRGGPCGVAIYHQMYHNPLTASLGQQGFHLFKDMYNEDTRYYAMIYRGPSHLLYSAIKAAGATLHVDDAYVKGYLVQPDRVKLQIFPK